jgi:hypothetical protein
MIKTGNFPEYILKGENGQMGPLLAMIHKDLDEAEEQSCEEDLPG